MARRDPRKSLLSFLLLLLLVLLFPQSSLFRGGATDDRRGQQTWHDPFDSHERLLVSLSVENMRTLDDRTNSKWAQ